MTQWSKLSRRTLLKGAAASALAAGIGNPARSKSQFLVFDALLFTNKPSSTKLGLSPSRLAYQSDLWPYGADRSTVPSAANIQTFLQKTKSNGSRLILDIEGT